MFELFFGDDEQLYYLRGSGFAQSCVRFRQKRYVSFFHNLQWEVLNVIIKYI